MKSYREIIAEIDALPCAILPNTIPREDILDQFSCHRSYIWHPQGRGGPCLRVYGFASAETRDAFVAHYAAEGAQVVASLTHDPA